MLLLQSLRVVIALFCHVELSNFISTTLSQRTWISFSCCDNAGLGNWYIRGFPAISRDISRLDYLWLHRTFFQQAA